MNHTLRGRASAVSPAIRLLGASALAVIVSQAAPQVALAQDDTAPAAVARGMEEIVVTARKREENIQDTPISITAVSAAQLEARSAVDLTAVQSIAPNLTLKNGGQSS